MIPTRGLLIPIIAALVLIATCTRSRADERFDCAAIRYYVAVHGRAAAIAWAVRNGYSLRDIAEARKCLRSAP